MPRLTHVIKGKKSLPGVEFKSAPRHEGMSPFAAPTGRGGETLWD